MLADAVSEGASVAQLRDLLEAALGHGSAELQRKRSGYERPVEVAFAARGGLLLAATPVAAALRADPAADGDRAFVLAACVVAALVEAGDEGTITAGAWRERLVLALPGDDADLAALAFTERAGDIDRLRTAAAVLPGGVLGELELRPPVGDNHPLCIAEKVARLGGDPTNPDSIEAHEDSVLAAARPHEDPDPAARVGRRILQRLDGMGKWGGYHTAFEHLARGFAGNDRALAQEVGEALLAAGLLAEKPSVGQRHVFLNPRRARDIHRLIETGETPSGFEWPRA